MNKNYLVSKAETIEQVKLGETYYNLEEKLNVENPIEQVKVIFEGLDFYERCKIILATTGMDIKKLNPYQIICHLLRILPLSEKLLHTIELSSPSTGKSSVYQRISLNYYCSSGAFTEPSLFGSVKPEKQGILSNYEAIAIDEVSDINGIAPSLLTKFKDFLSSGNIGRHGVVDFQTTSVAFLGNIKPKEKHLSDDPFSIKSFDIFSVLPEAFNHEAFKSRISYVIPGWILPKELPLITDENTMGFNTYLFADYLTAWKKEPYSFNIKNYPELKKMLVNVDTRINSAIEKSIRAFLKLVFPQEDYTYDVVVAIGEIIYACNRILFNDLIKINKSKSVQKLVFQLLKNKLPYDSSNILKAYTYGNRFIIHFKDDKEHLYKIAINEQGKIDNEKEGKIYETSNDEIKEMLLPFVSLTDNKIVSKFKFHEIYGGFQEIELTNQEKINDPIEKINIEVQKLKNENKDLKIIISSIAKYLNELRKDTDSIRTSLNKDSYYSNGIFYEDYNFFKMPKEHLKDLFENQMEKISDVLEISPIIKEYEVCFNKKEEKFMLLNYSKVNLKLEKEDPLDQFN